MSPPASAFSPSPEYTDILLESLNYSDTLCRFGPEDYGKFDSLDDHGKVTEKTQTAVQNKSHARVQWQTGRTMHESALKRDRGPHWPSGHTWIGY